MNDGTLSSRMLMLAITAVAAAPATAQVRTAPVHTAAADDEGEQSPSPPAPFRSRTPSPSGDNPSGRVARSPTGFVGQRQTRDVLAEETGAAVTGRIANRLQTRVRSRIRNRIDRGYAARTDLTIPFAAADDQIRTPIRPR